MSQRSSLKTLFISDQAKDSKYSTKIKVPEDSLKTHLSFKWFLLATLLACLISAGFVLLAYFHVFPLYFYSSSTTYTGELKFGKLQLLIEGESLTLSTP